MNEIIDKIIVLGDLEGDKNSGDENRKAQAKAVERLREHLKDIPSILYYNAPVLDVRLGEKREIDALWIHPHMGVLVIEVKAWDYRYLMKGEVRDDGNRKCLKLKKQMLVWLRIQDRLFSQKALKLTFQTPYFFFLSFLFRSFNLLS